MPKVTIVKPNITPEQEKKALKFFSDCFSNLIEKKYGIKVKIETHKKENN